MKGALIRIQVVFAAITFFLFSCNQKTAGKLFTRLTAEESGIHFNNEISENNSSHSFINEFGYMGGGVAVGDFNNDGKKDLLFTGNQVSSRLYINLGDNKFEDITDKAGVKTDVWCTGVSIVDINQDGYDDIYICVFGKDLLHRSKNLLYVNQHNLTFKEEAVDYQLADTGYSTQAVFFDYDRDGDLDMYLTNYLLSENNANNIIPRDRSGFSPANDRLYRNDGDSAQKGHPVFSDVTLQAGIRENGYGLGVVSSDFNNDGWPDIYVANDFVSNDELWLNNHDGTFTNCIAQSFRHQSYSSMGADAADINNDARTDILSLDMLPEYNDRKKTSFALMNHDRYDAERAMGYEPEFMRNMLQLNNGNRMKADTAIPFFSEIGQLAGIQATDWSWSVLLADFNNDGWKDIHVTNGVGRDFINADFLDFSSNVFSSALPRKEQEDAIRKKLADLKHINLSDYLFLNNRDLTFTDASQEGGIQEPAMSNGAVYADLDNDGDLDLLVNNINQEAFVFINNTNQPGKPLTRHFLSLHLDGDPLNRQGFGTKILMYNRGGVQVQEENPVRGYFSSVDRQLLFGLGSDEHIDSLLVIWPDQKKQVIKNFHADTTIQLSWKNAADGKPESILDSAKLFSDITGKSGIFFKHQETPFNDYAVMRLLPQKYSQQGPVIATGDINQDGKTDFFIGNGAYFSGKIFKQDAKSFFTSVDLTVGTKLQEDIGCILFDADQDGDADLLITGGDLQYDENSVNYIPRLYINDGKGNFSFKPDAIPENIKTIAGCVSAGDLDGDGDLDVFIGGRVSRKYPLPPPSYILRNDKGIFTDVTAEVCPALKFPGMVTAAVWADLDNDRQPDLIVTGEWMPVRFFKNNHGKLSETTSTAGLTHNNGMWRTLIAEDMDGDGDIDLVAGNLGLNNEYRVSPAEPMELCAADLDRNGLLDPVFFYYIKGTDGKNHSFPGMGRNQLAEQVPIIKKQFLKHADFAKADFKTLFRDKAEKEILKLFCDEVRSCYFENTGNGHFVKRPLPVEAQFAPVNAIISDDFDGDGYQDLLLAGNEYQTDVRTGRYDASYGCFLKGNARRQFTVVPSVESGFIIDGDVKNLALIRLSADKKIVLAAVNNDSLRVFSIHSKPRKPK